MKQSGFRLERQLEAACVRWATRHGILHVKMNVMGSRGWPDRIFFHKGPIFVEFKRTALPLSPLQAILHKRLWMENCKAYRVESLPQFVELMQ
jgi:hypothetical protein